MTTETENPPAEQSAGQLWIAEIQAIIKQLDDAPRRLAEVVGRLPRNDLPTLLGLWDTLKVGLPHPDSAGVFCVQLRGRWKEGAEGCARSIEYTLERARGAIKDALAAGAAPPREVVRVADFQATGVIGSGRSHAGWFCGAVMSLPPEHPARAWLPLETLPEAFGSRVLVLSRDDLTYYERADVVKMTQQVIDVEQRQRREREDKERHERELAERLWAASPSGRMARLEEELAAVKGRLAEAEAKG